MVWRTGPVRRTFAGTHGIAKRPQAGRSCAAPGRQLTAREDRVVTLVPRLRRITTSGRFVPEIDGLRCLAIAMVVIYHLDDTLRARAAPALRGTWTGSWASHLAQQGHYGVQVFFVLSGFILSLPFALHALGGAPPVRLRAYLLRRVTRLEPPYIASLLVRAALLLAVGRLSLAAMLGHLTASMLYVHNVVFGEPSTISVVAWSLEIEVQFYLLAPALCAVFFIRSARVRRALLLECMAAVGVAASLWMRWESRAGLTLLFSLQFFLAGLLLTDIYVVDWIQTPRPHALADLVGVAALGGILVVAWSDTLPGLLLPPLILLLYGSVFRGRLLRGLSRWPPVVVVGGMCYTIYLWHYGILGVVQHFTQAATVPSSYAATLAIQLALTGALVLAVSIVLFLAIERPCMRRDWPQRLAQWVRSAWRRRVTVPAPSAALTGGGPGSGAD
jgi:peptidoglycan/LPS O-acetylase OafA/YrhL